MNTYTVSADHYVYAMSGDNAPVLKAKPGSELIFETCDCFHNQITSSDQSIDSLNWEQINPATGPVYIEGAEPGDALKVSIRQIEFTADGVIAAIPDAGMFGDQVKSSTVRVMEVSTESIAFGDGISLSASPMIGVIGTAPAEGSVPCGTPGSHGGNMDCTLIGPGAILYLPVFHEGGLLAMGDVHACMGDGEIMGTGVEIAARIHVFVELVKGRNLPDPMLETDDTVYSIASADTMEAAAKKATSNMRDIVSENLGLDNDTTGMLLSATGSLEVCQVVDPKLTMRFGFPKKYLK